MAPIIPMLRTFAQHRVRSTQSLEGYWDFAPHSAERAIKPPKRFPRKIRVPSCWEALPGLEAYRGRAWFRTAFDGVPGRATRLVFGGVSHTGEVAVDGRNRGSHYDAFTPWAILDPAAQSRGHELVVGVDNRFGEGSALHIPNDYYTYGGLTRPVELQHVPEAFIERVWATPTRDPRRGWGLELRVWVRNWSRQKLRRRLTVTVAGIVQDLGEVVVPARAVREVEAVMAVPQAEPWRPESPRLYELTAELYDGVEVVDDLIDRVGFRTVAIQGTRILLNGEEVFLRGYNRHEDHPTFGCAIPLEQMSHDLGLVRDLGCNFIRTSHYPNDQRFLDLCDELGVLV